jgi:formylglycine-generating enzyme required for sulfatase activity
MGADSGGEDDEHPAHTVTLRAFYLDATEVTNAAYDECIAAKVCPKHATRAGFDGADQPVDFVSWDEAKKYCEWRGKRLPREAEFERAVRDSDARTFPWGNDALTKDRAVYGTPTTKPVGSKPAGRGPYGHDDLAGNLWEWMEDEYDPFAYTRPTASDGKPGSCAQIMDALAQIKREHRRGFTGSNPINSCEHAIRGGAYNQAGMVLRATNRVHHPGNYRIVMLGFRCAKDAP